MTNTEGPKYKNAPYFDEAHDYYVELITDKDWVEANKGKTVAIVGKQILGYSEEDETKTEFMKRTIEAQKGIQVYYQIVDSKLPVARLSPRSVVNE